MKSFISHIWHTNSQIHRPERANREHILVNDIFED